MKYNFNLRSFPWTLISVFLFLTASIIITGYFYYQSQKEEIVIEKKNELSAIADLKVGQIVQWRNERLADAKVIFQSASLSRQIESFFQNPEDIKRKQELLHWMKSLIDSYSYYDIYLLDSQGSIKLSVTSQQKSLNTYMQNIFKEAVQRREIIFSDLYKSETGPIVHLDLQIPLIKSDGYDRKIIGAVLLRIDPSKLLFPFVQSWPTPSRTSETLLLRREGDSVVFLNELRHLKNTALILRLPIANDKLPASMAARGIERIVEGFDYRNIAVIASLKRIPESSWFMVAKVDQEEIYSPLRQQTTIIILVVVLIILVVASTLGFWWRHQRAKYYRQRYQSEQERQALISHFDYLFKYANDIIVLADKDLNIIEANDRALETYGCTRNELIGLNIIRLRAPQTAPQLQERIKSLDKVKTATYETVHQRKDGSTFPVELSARVIEIDGNKYYQTIGRDITERKKAEEAILESEEKFRTIFENNSAAIAIIDPDTTISMVNDAYCQLSGYAKEEVIGMSWTQQIPPDDLERLKEYNRLRLTNPNDAPDKYEFKFYKKDGEIRYGLMSVTMTQNPSKIITSFIDITERKRAEEKLKESEETYRTILENTGTADVLIEDDTTISYANEEFEFLSGYSKQEIEGKKKWTEFVVQEDLEQMRAQHRLRRQNQEIALKHYEFRFIDRIGKIHEIYLTIDLIPGTKRSVASLLDITERKNAEEKLQVSETRYRRLFESAQDAILILDAETGIIFDANPFLTNILGFTKEEVMGKYLWDIGAFKDTARSKIAFEELQQKEYIRYENLPLQSKDGRLFQVEFVSNVYLVDHKKVIQCNIRDLTERYQAEEKFQSLSLRNEAILASVPDIIMEVDNNKIYKWANRAGIDFFGEDVIGKSAGYYFEGEQETYNVVQPLFQGSEDIIYLESWQRRWDGKNRLLAWWCRVLKDEEGNVTGALSTAQDITERKRAEEEILVSEEKFRNLFEHSSVGKSMTGIDGSLHVNNAFCEIVGYSEDELKTKKWKDITHPDDIQQTVETIQSLLDGKTSQARFEKRYIHKNGSSVWTDVSTYLQRDKGGKPQYFITSVIDITERKLAEEALVENEKYLRAIIDHAPFGAHLYELQPEEKLVFIGANLSADKILHIDHQQLIGKTIEEAFPPLAQTEIPSTYRRVAASGENFQMDQVDYDDTTIRGAFEVNAFQIGSNRMAVFFRDITERKQADEKVRQLNDELEKRVLDRTAQLEVANKELETFAYSVSHDLRAPLRGIDGWSLALKEDFHKQLSGQALQDLDRIRSETQRMGQLIDDLLKLSRITRAEMEPTSIDLSGMAHSIIARMKKENADRKIKFIIQPELKAWGDSSLLDIVLTNLFENACKFTRPCSQAQIEFGQTEVDGKHEFFIRDNGVGFDMQYAKNLFGAFQRMHKLSEFPGTGIGLATVQRIIHRHGGRVWADAQVDNGATFYFTLKEEV